MTRFPLNEFQKLSTPFYYYDLNLLRQTVKAANTAKGDDRFKIHYAVKANANPTVLRPIQEGGFGIDCVSGAEIETAVKNGFDPSTIVFAGVGKTDNEINMALRYGIGCFNIESMPELENINTLAKENRVIANIAIRVNPDIDAHTHHYITTGLSENKFGIDLRLLDKVIASALEMGNVKLIGLHFHIGSQITDMTPFKLLCEKINGIQEEYIKKGVSFKTINVGGGLGIDYDNPEANPIPDFKSYFDIFRRNLRLYDNQELHFELGRAIVAQCGSLISRTIYVKEGVEKRFAIIDAGMTDLIRPALYGAHHKIENISNPEGEIGTYDVVGPICESSDVFGKDEAIPQVRRGDMIALRSAGAYGEVMASRYNLRELPGTLSL